MGIQKDAGELLLYCYSKYLRGENNTSDDFKEVSGWDRIRSRNAARYLLDMNLMLAHLSDQGDFIVVRVLPEGIRIIEDEGRFKSTFGFKINLGVFSFSWDIQR